MQVSQPLVPLVDEFASRLFAELDYVQEGHNCERFRVCPSLLPDAARVGGVVSVTSLCRTADVFFLPPLHV